MASGGRGRHGAQGEPATARCDAHETPAALSGTLATLRDAGLLDRVTGLVVGKDGVQVQMVYVGQPGERRGVSERDEEIRLEEIMFGSA